MAQLLQKLEDQLKCSICLDTYIDPKQLQCNHVYCQQCLVKLVFQNQQGQLILPCPNCRQATPVPASGVSGLQAAFQIIQFLEIVKEQKKSRAIVNLEEAEGASQEDITTLCLDHGRNVELYCETCSEAICWKCIKTSARHHSHKYVELSEAFEDYKKELPVVLEPVEEQLTVIDGLLAQLDSRNDEISEQQAAIEVDVHTTFTRLHETLDCRKTEVISRLNELTLAKLNSLAVQRNQLETIQAQLSSCLLFMRKTFETSNQAEALSMKDMRAKQVKELASTFQPFMYTPNVEANLAFSAVADFKAECWKYGKVYFADLPDPYKCCVTGISECTNNSGELSSLLHTLNFDSKPCTVSETSVSSELISEVVGAKTGGSIEKTGPNLFRISYKPTMKGKHQLHIKVEGQHVMGSPFPVIVRSSIEIIGTPILIVNEIRGPMGVAISPGGRMVVTEADRHCVTVFSASGERVRSFGARGSGEGLLKRPVGVTLDATGNIYVTDTQNHYIQKFTSDGKFLSSVGTKGSGPLQFHEPYSIMFNAHNGRLYVGDAGNCRVQILNSDLSFHATFGEIGKTKGQFVRPRHIACDNTGNVFVVDRGNHRIQVFTAEGEFVRQFAHTGELLGPFGIAIDYCNIVYVSEWYNSHRVSVLNARGKLVTSFGSWGEGPGQFKGPCGLAVDSSGIVYVCDYYNKCVKLF